MCSFGELEALSSKQVRYLCEYGGILEPCNRWKRLSLYERLLNQESLSIIREPLFVDFFTMRAEELAELVSSTLEIDPKEVTRGEACTMLVEKLKQQEDNSKMKALFSSREEAKQTLRSILNLEMAYPYVLSPIKWENKTIWFQPHRGLRSLTTIEGRSESFFAALNQLSLKLMNPSLEYFGIDEDDNLWFVAGWDNLVKDEFYENEVSNEEPENSNEYVVELSGSSISESENSDEIFDC
jgi:hypothetical protein